MLKNYTENGRAFYELKPFVAEVECTTSRQPFLDVRYKHLLVNALEETKYKTGSC